MTEQCVTTLHLDENYLYAQTGVQENYFGIIYITAQLSIDVSFSLFSVHLKVEYTV